MSHTGPSEAEGAGTSPLADAATGRGGEINRHYRAEQGEESRAKVDNRALVQVSPRNRGSWTRKRKGRSCESMELKARSPEFLRRINPQPHRLGYAETPKGWRDLPRLDYRTWFMCPAPGFAMEVEIDGRRVDLQGGQGILVPPATWVKRRTESGRGGRRYWVTFDWNDEHVPDERTSLVYASMEPDPTRLRPAPSWVPAALWGEPVALPDGFHEDFERLNDRFWHGSAASRASARGLLLEVLLKIFSGWCDWPESAAPDRRPVEDRLLELLRAAATQPFRRTPAIEVLLSRAGQSHDHVSRKFRAAYGVTPLTYLNRLRMERAKEMLEDTELSVSEVARRLGYGDFRYFTRLFRKVTGRTPRTHKQSVRRRKNPSSPA